MMKCTDSSSIARIAARLKDGDDQALAELFSVYRERLRRMVEFRLDKRLQGRVDASDVLQEAYLDAAQRIRHYAKKPEISIFVWLRQVTTQRLIDVHRRHLNAKRRDAKQEVSINAPNLTAATSASMAVQLVGHFASPSQMAIRAEMLDLVESALENMDAIDREVLAMRHFEELTNNEVAEVLGLTKSAASNRYVRALLRLKQVLAEVSGFFAETETETGRPPDEQRKGRDASPGRS